MKLFFSLLLFLVLPISLQAQRIVADLDSNVEETSGVVSNSNGTFWTHNDSGDQAYIYLIDTNGTLLRSVHITNADNVDWEDISKDEYNNLYIADIGNNDNDRTDLVIYKIPNPLAHNDNSIQAQKIRLHYPNQHDFPPTADKKYFDAEAILVFHDTISIFTKNRTNPFDGKLYQYTVPTQAGNYAAHLLDSFNTNIQNIYMGWVTGAAIDVLNNKAAILSQSKLFLFNNVRHHKFLQQTNSAIFFTSFTQKEAITFYNGDIWGTDEIYSGTGSTLYEIPLPPNSTAGLSTIHRTHKLQYYYHDGIAITLNNTNNTPVSYQLYSLGGKINTGKLAASEQKNIPCVEGWYYLAIPKNTIAIIPIDIQSSY